MTTIEQGTRLDCSFIDSLHRRNIILTECYLLLYPNHMEYKCVADYETDERADYDGIWKEVKSNYRWTRTRQNLSEVSMYYDNPIGQWMVSIEFSGVADPSGWLYESSKDALVLYRKLQDYMLIR